MTLPVLLDSRKPGSSSWVHVRPSTKGVRVSGLHRDDKLILVLRPSSGEDEIMEFTGIYGEVIETVDGAQSIKAIHEVCSARTHGVFVELI